MSRYFAHFLEGNAPSRTATDTVSLTDAVTDALGSSRSADDTVAFTDSVEAVGPGDVARSFTDTVTITDAVVRSTAMGRTTTDNLAVTDSIIAEAPLHTPSTLALNWIEDATWNFPFNVGGIGDLVFPMPFDVEGQPFTAEYRLPFNVIGNQSWVWSTPFDIEGALTWRFSFPFDVVEAVAAPVIGGNLGSGGLWLTVAAPAGSTSVTLSAPVAPGVILRIGSATEYRTITGVVGSVASFTAPLLDSYPIGTPVAESASTATAPVNAGDTSVTVGSTTGIIVGSVIQIDGEARTVSVIAGLVITVTEPFAADHASGSGIYVVGSSASVPSTTAFVSGLLIFDKGGNFLGNIPQGWFTITDAPSRVISDSGSMQFRMARADDGPNPYLSLIFDDRLVLVLDQVNSEPWLGSMTVQDWAEGQATISVADATSLWSGPKIKLEEAPSTQVSAAAVYQKVLDLMNVQRAADNELVWDADIDTDAPFYGEVQMEGTALDLFEQIARRSVTEFSWRARYEGGKARATLVVRESFSDVGFTVTDGDGGNVAARPRLLVDPQSIVNAVRVRGRATDLTTKNNQCSTSGSIDCLDWMAEANDGTSSPTQLIPEGFASVDPGVRRRRETLDIELDWGMSTPAQQEAANDVTAQATALYGTFLRAFHDRYGRPFYSTDNWQYDGPPADLERFLTTGLGWRTHLRLVEYQGKPASMVMLSNTQQQALLVLYDIQTGEKTVKRTWFTETGGTINATRMSVHGQTKLWSVIGGVITGYTLARFDHSSALVGPPITYMYPGHDSGSGWVATSYKTLRRVVSISEDGALTEAMYFDSDQPNGPTSGIYYDPPFNTQPVFTRPTIGDAPYKIFRTVQLPSGVAADDYIGRVYDFESRSICEWDPRRDGIGGLLNKTTVVHNAPSTGPRWHFIPWGDGSGTTELSVGISATETQIYIANAFVLPQTYPYAATIGTGLNAEEVNVIAGSGTLLTVQRGINGSTAIVHPVGTSISKSVVCDTTPDEEPDSTETIPWPEGQAWAERMLAKLSKPVRRLTVNVVNQDNEWASVRLGSLITVDIQSEGPPEGVVGTWRVLGWAPDYHGGTMELLTEEVL